MGIGDAERKRGRLRILFVGPTKRMEEVYAAADALILPTFYDSFGLVVLEALGHGLPVVSTEFLGAGYLVKENGVGVIVGSPKDVEGMAAALEDCRGRRRRRVVRWRSGRGRRAGGCCRGSMSRG